MCALNERPRPNILTIVWFRMCSAECMRGSASFMGVTFSAVRSDERYGLLPLQSRQPQVFLFYLGSLSHPGFVSCHTSHKEPHVPDTNRYASMPYVRCGRSGLKLPRIALGLWHNFGGVDTRGSGNSLTPLMFFSRQIGFANCSGGKKLA